VTTVSTRWVLAYDESCGKCRGISRVVRQASAGRLEIAPLTRADVREWRHSAFCSLDENAPWAPTLLRVRADGVRAWTGPAMGWPLLRALRLPAALNVVGALGRSRYDATHPPMRQTHVLARLTELGFGAVAAAGLLFTGRLPLPAQPKSGRVNRWIVRHRDELPQHYNELAGYPNQYRSAIYAASPPWLQRRLWLEAVLDAQEALREPTPAQRRLFAAAIELAEWGLRTAEIADSGRGERCLGEDADSGRGERCLGEDADGGQGEQRLAEFRAAVTKEFPHSRAERLLLRLAEALGPTAREVPG
jgi:hypothetical protein